MVFSNLLYLAVFLTPERQAIHELIARTVVVERSFAQTAVPGGERDARV
jgi:hypothetical protein